MPDKLKARPGHGARPGAMHAPASALYRESPGSAQSMRRSPSRDSADVVESAAPEPEALELLEGSGAESRLNARGA